MVSVIVPIFNTEQYLSKCIESIRLQSYQDIEIILVNDGSKDRSEKICKEAVLLDCRVHYYYKENSGVTSTRKFGVKMSSGEFVLFVDSDDWIEKDYIKKLIKASNESNADIVTSRLLFETGNYKKIIRDAFIPGLHNTVDLLDRLIYNGEFYYYGIQPHMVTKLFKRRYLKKILDQLDDRITIGEDAAVVYSYILQSKIVFVSEICGYHYLQHIGAATKVYHENETDRLYRLYDYMKKFFYEKVFHNQINQYMKYLFLLRNISYFDDDKNFFKSYGGVCKNHKLIIYGAGGVGQQIIYAMKKAGIQPMAWLDKNDVFYREQGLNVRSCNDINFLIDYDYILIAVIEKRVADDITEYLLRQGVNRSKICWFSNDFLNDELFH